MSKIITLQPTRGLLFTKAQQALEQELLANRQVPFILRTDNLPIPDCRNKLVETALTIKDWTHALLVDDDIIIPEGGLKAMLDKGTDIAFIDYPMHYTGDKWGAVGTATYDNWLPGQDWKDKPVAWAGLGCALAKREVFEKLDKPWFMKTSKTFARDDNGKITMSGDDARVSGGGGEDTYFYMKAREKGFKIANVYGMTAGHARIVRTVKAVEEGKYQTQHKIAINEVIKCPYR